LIKAQSSGVWQYKIVGNEQDSKTAF